MNKICIIGVYFGKFPECFNLWLKSAKYNASINFLLYTDQDLRNLPENFKVINGTLQEFSKLASKKLDLGIEINKAYKCCDFKPVYGIILEDYIKEYDFWGHCDFDLVFGDLRKYLSNEILQEYDKILSLGHLSLYRNTYECNNNFKLEGSNVGGYKDVFTSNKHYAFDEWNGIYSIYKKNNLRMYEERIFADISSIYKRFRLALSDINYNNQVFYWEDGKIYRAYIQNKNVKIEEFIYIHFKKRDLKLLEVIDDKTNSFYITSKGFIKKEIGKPSKEEIQKLNPFNGYIYEKLELIDYNIKNLFNRIRKRIEESDERYEKKSDSN